MAPPHNYQICNFSPLRMKKEFCAIFHLRELVFPRDKEMLPVLPYTSVYVTCCKLLLLAGYQHQYRSRHHLPPVETNEKKFLARFFASSRSGPAAATVLSLSSARRMVFEAFADSPIKSLLKVCIEKKSYFSGP